MELRKAGFTASKKVGTGYSAGYETWIFAGHLYVTHHISTGSKTATDADTINKKNTEMLEALTSAGITASANDNRIEIF